MTVAEKMTAGRNAAIALLYHLLVPLVIFVKDCGLLLNLSTFVYSHDFRQQGTYLHLTDV